MAKLLNMFDKLDDIIYKPIEAVCDWLTEPLKSWENKREIKKETELLKTKSKIKKEEKEQEKEHLENASKLKREENEHDINLKIKEKTEIKRVLAEIEEWKKKEELKRMVAVSEAIIKYHKTLTEINTDALKAIGSMPIELRHKAHSLISEKYNEYKKIQDQAWEDTAIRLMKIETDFKENEQGKEILIKMVDKMAANIIDSAGDFMKQLKVDLIEINKSIIDLTKSGEKALEKHFDQYRAIGNRGIKELGDNIQDAEVIED